MSALDVRGNRREPPVSRTENLQDSLVSALSVRDRAPFFHKHYSSVNCQKRQALEERRKFRNSDAALAGDVKSAFLRVIVDATLEQASTIVVCAFAFAAISDMAGCLPHDSPRSIVKSFQ